MSSVAASLVEGIVLACAEQAIENVVISELPTMSSFLQNVKNLVSFSQVASQEAFDAIEHLATKLSQVHLVSLIALLQSKVVAVEADVKAAAPVVEEIAAAVDPKDAAAVTVAVASVNAVESVVNADLNKAATVAAAV